MDLDFSQHIPSQHMGNSCDSQSTLVCADTHDAENKFKHIIKRLFNINKWEIYAGKTKASFAHTYKNGESKTGGVDVGDKIKISIPGPHSKVGHGHDWVEIISVKKDISGETQYLKVVVKPCANPLHENSSTAHFFSSDATNTFLLMKCKNTIQVSIHGRNELPNMQCTGLYDKFRNYIVSKGGILGGSKIQWQSLTDSLIKF